MRLGSDPVFLYGALRSGTTVFRLMLDAHPLLSTCGEVDFLLDYLEPDSSRPDGWRSPLSSSTGTRRASSAGRLLA